MKIAHRIASLAIVTVLAVAGVAIAAAPSSAAPAGKKTTYSGITVISLDKSLKPVADQMVLVAPAKKKGSKLTFPVVGVEGNGILLAGGTRAGSDPIIITKDNGTGAITLSVAGTSVEVFTISDWKVRDTSRKGKVTTQRWQGVLHLTQNQAVVDKMNAAAGTKFFTAGQVFGKIRTTVKSTKG